jgi:4-amino-4-deoxychorismate lyase
MNQPLVALVDGKPCSAAQLEWALDRGLHYGDGLFETMIARNGHIRFAALHRQRLATGCQRLRIAVDQDPLWQQAGTLAQRHGNALLKVLVTRGTATQRGYGPAGDEVCRSVVLAYPPPATTPPHEISVVSLQVRLGENPALAGIKHCNRLEQVLARLELPPRDFEGLMCSSSGRVISGTMSNVFLDTDAGLVTPSLDLCGIAGVMRAVVLREAAAMDIAVRIADVPAAALAACRGMFLTNVRLGVQPVSCLDGRALSGSEQVRALAQRIASLED